MNIEYEDNEDNNNEVEVIESSENNLYDRLLSKKDTTDEVVDDDFDDGFEIENIESDKIVNTEDKKRFKKLNTLGAKGVVTIVDIGIVNLWYLIVYRYMLCLSVN